MKKMFRVMLPGALALAFVAAPAVTTPVFAQDTTAAAGQDDAKRALYDKFLANRTNNQKVANDVAQEYLQKYASDNDEIVKYLQTWVGKYKAAEDVAAKQGRYNTVIKAYEAKNAPEVFTTAKAVLATEPDNIFPVLVMVDTGLQQATQKTPVDTYNNDTISYARQALERIESGKVAADQSYYPFKTKEEAQAWLNYTIGYITFARMKDQEIQAAPYFYKALQFNSDLKKYHVPYYGIAYAYQQQYNKAVADFKTKFADLKEPNEESRLAEGTYIAISDRAIDAYARAYKVAAADPKFAAARDNYLKTLTEFYKRRHNQTTNLNSFADTIMSKPMPDPTSPVTPVIEAPATTTTGGAAAVTSETPSTAVTSTPAATNSGTAVRERTTPASTNNGASTTKAATNGAKTSQKPAQKPAAKKPTANSRPQR